jgi:hypothetical protein
MECKRKTKKKGVLFCKSLLKSVYGQRRTALKMVVGEQPPYEYISSIGLCDQQEIILHNTPVTEAMNGIYAATENVFGLAADSIEVRFVHTQRVITPPCRLQAISLRRWQLCRRH